MLNYDFPLSPKARTYLKFEKVFSAAAENSQVGTVPETMCLLRCIVDYLDLVDGSGSIKVEVLKDLERCDSRMRVWLQDPEADKDFVGQLRERIAEARNVLDTFTRQRVVLQSDPIIELIKPRFHTPCGVNCFDTPLFTFWLQLPHEERLRTVKAWLHELDCLRIPITTVLYLWRLCSDPQKRVAAQGFLQENANNCDLISISYDPASVRGYPVVSGFQSRINIHFLPYEKGAPVGDIDFELAYIRSDLS
jgi:cell division FtsZ-interacting protein ZapD